MDSLRPSLASTTRRSKPPRHSWFKVVDLQRIPRGKLQASPAHACDAMRCDATPSGTLEHPEHPSPAPEAEIHDANHPQAIPKSMQAPPFPFPGEPGFRPPPPPWTSKTYPVGCQVADAQRNFVQSFS